MRALKSYGIAAILVLIGAFWLGTGLFVNGGNGPKGGEMSVVSALEGDEGGILTSAVNATGIAKTVHHEHGADDPALSIAERAEFINAKQGTKLSVRTRQFNLEPMPLEVTLRGHTAARAAVKATAQTSDTVLTVDVKEGQKVNIGDLICSLDNGTRLASVEQAKAAVSQVKAGLKQAQLSYKTNQALLK